MRVLSWFILALAAAGLVLSAVSLVNHYKKSATEYCDFGATFNCDLVNRSIYSELSGLVAPKTGGTNIGPIGHVPVAGVGVLGYALLMALSRPLTRRAAILMLVAGLLGWAFALYLTYIEAYILVVYCILCLGSLGVISVLTVVAAIQTAKIWRATAGSSASPVSPVVRIR